MAGQRLYRWRMSAMPGVSAMPGADYLGGTGTWQECHELLSSYLHGMAIGYPRSREGILEVRKSLLAASPPRAWTGVFRVHDLPYEVDITLAFVPEEDTLVNAKKESPPPKPVPAPAPRLRAGHALRRRYQEHLTTMYAEGYLDSALFEERSARVQDVVYEDELPALVGELPPLPAEEPEKLPSKRELAERDMQLDDARVRERRSLRCVTGMTIGAGAVGLVTGFALLIPPPVGDRMLLAFCLVVMAVVMSIGLTALYRNRE